MAQESTEQIKDIITRNGEEISLQLNALMKKGNKQVEVHFVLTNFQIYSVKVKKKLKEKQIISTKGNHFYNLKSIFSQDNLHIIEQYNKISRGIPKQNHFKFEIRPEKRDTRLRAEIYTKFEENVTPGHGYIDIYRAYCFLYKIPQSRIFIQYVEANLKKRTSRTLNLSNFQGIEVESKNPLYINLKPVLCGLKYNTWFHELRLENVNRKEAIGMVIDVLTENRVLTTVSISGLPNEGLGQIGGVFEANGNSSLQNLDLSKINITDKLACVIGKCLSHKKNGLTSLRISHCNLSKAGSASLFGMLKESSEFCGKIKQLHCSHNNLKAEGGEEFVALLKAVLLNNNQLTHLSVGSTGVPLEGLLSHLTNFYDTLTLLDLSGNDINQGAASTLLCKLVESSFLLRNLDMSSTSLGINQLERVLHSLCKNKNIEKLELNLSTNGLGVRGAEIISTMLFHAKQLESLVLNENELKDDGMSLIVASMIGQPTLRRLSLARNIRAGEQCPKTKTQLELFAKGNRSVVWMDLSGDEKNFALGENLHGFLTELANQTAIQTLDLQWNDLRDNGIQVLCAALKKNKSVKSLKLDHNNISISGLEAFNYALFENDTLCDAPFPEDDVKRFARKKTEDMLGVLRSSISQKLEQNRIRRSVNTDLRKKKKIDLLRSFNRDHPRIKDKITSLDGFSLIRGVSQLEEEDNQALLVGAMHPRSRHLSIKDGRTRSSSTRKNMLSGREVPSLGRRISTNQPLAFTPPPRLHSQTIQRRYSHHSSKTRVREPSLREPSLFSMELAGIAAQAQNQLKQDSEKRMMQTQVEDIDLGDMEDMSDAAKSALSVRGTAAISRLLKTKKLDLSRIRDKDSFSTALHYVCDLGDPELLSFVLSQENCPRLINARDNIGYTPLHRLMRTGLSTDCITLLVDYGANIEARDKSGWSPLQVCVAFYERPLENSNENIFISKEKDPVMEKKYQIERSPLDEKNTPLKNVFRQPTDTPSRQRMLALQTLLQKGANPNAQDLKAWTPLHRAALKGFSSAISILLGFGADTDSADSNDSTPLHKCARNGHADCVKILLDHGAMANLKDNNGQTPLDLALIYNQELCVELLRGVTDTGTTGETEIEQELSSETSSRLSETETTNQTDSLSSLINPTSIRIEVLDRIPDFDGKFFAPTFSPSRIFNICIVGTQGSGKTTLARRFMTGVFPESAPSPFEIEAKHRKIVLINSIEMILNIVDVSGAEIYLPFLKKFIHASDGFILACSSADDPKTTALLESEFLPMIQNEKTGVERVPVVIATLKSDLTDEDSREKTFNSPQENARALAEKHHYPYFDVSSKNNKNVPNVFISIAQEMYRIYNRAAAIEKEERKRVNQREKDLPLIQKRREERIEKRKQNNPEITLNSQSQKPQTPDNSDLLENRFPFTKIITHSDLVVEFENFLRHQFADENLLFYYSVQKWKSIPQEESGLLSLAAKKILEEFISTNSYVTINISGKCRDSIEKKIRALNFNRDLFDEAVEQVLVLLKNNYYFAFLEVMKTQNDF
ncbi:leucine-rich repeat isoform f [Anaeramoeba ignava]|uniref:Leucine-rich repeat isoform f n=1 Tax=Anaeramoeba ignava TaxID=1746090 RepID=A0A9Q0LSD9_ANAIG|nr:leucine-rich repeat isoform f [Anaeramoeba ignava]